VLGYAQSHLAERGILLVVGDIQRMGYVSESFDRVVMSEILEHLDDDEAWLREVWRVMKPGAILAITVPHRHYPCWYDPINLVAEGLFRRPIQRGPFAGIWANHQRLCERDQLVDLVERSGFAINALRKGLIEHNLLPEFISKSTHRFRGQENRGSLLNPINWMLALFSGIDHLNTDSFRMATKRTFVNISVKARKN
jgi:SAM-dependent methyltransferase